MRGAKVCKARCRLLLHYVPCRADIVGHAASHLGPWRAVSSCGLTFFLPMHGGASSSMRRASSTLSAYSACAITIGELRARAELGPAAGPRRRSRMESHKRHALCEAGQIDNQQTKSSLCFCKGRKRRKCRWRGKEQCARLAWLTPVRLIASTPDSFVGVASESGHRG